MRRLVLMSLLAGAMGCGNGTAPESTLISIRLLDDGGKSAGRNPVYVALGNGKVIDVHTGEDGKATVDVGVPGTYPVRVVPRAGFNTAGDLAKDVIVAAKESAEVRFTLHRDGSSEAGTTIENPNGSGTRCSYNPSFGWIC